MHHFHFPGLDVTHHHTVTTVTINDKSVHIPLVINLYFFLILHELFMEGMQDGMTGTISGKTGTWFGMPTETALGDFPIRCAAENTTHMFQFIDDSGSGFNILFHRILIVEKVATLDGVVHMFFPTIRLRVPQRGGNTALCRTRMRPGGIDFGQQADIQLFTRFQSATHPSKTSTHNHYIMLNHKISSCQVSG